MRHGANAGATGEPRQSPAPARPQDVGVGAVRRVCDISVRRFSSDARRQHPDDTSQAREARCPQRVADDPTGEIPIGRKVADGFVQPRFAALPARIAWALIRGLTRAGRRRNLLFMSTTFRAGPRPCDGGHRRDGIEVLGCDQQICRDPAAIRTSISCVVVRGAPARVAHRAGVARRLLGWLIVS